MARENQGLQIALIIFVMLTVMLGVLLLVYVRKMRTRSRRRGPPRRWPPPPARTRNQAVSECKDLKRMIGYPTKSQQEMAAQFEGDMKPFGQFPEDALYYSPILGQLAGTIKTKDDTIAEKEKENKRLEADFARREKEMDKQIAGFEATAKENGDKADRIARESEKIEADFLAEQEALEKLMEEIKTDRAKDAEHYKAEIEKIDAERAKVAKTAADLRNEVMGLRPGSAGPLRRRNHRGQPATAQRLDQRRIGRRPGPADDFRRLFRRHHRPGQGRKEGRHRSDPSERQHRAMARILEDKNTDPIVPATRSPRRSGRRASRSTSP